MEAWKLMIFLLLGFATGAALWDALETIYKICTG